MQNSLSDKNSVAVFYNELGFSGKEVVSYVSLWAYRFGDIIPFVNAETALNSVGRCKTTVLGMWAVLSLKQLVGLFLSLSPVLVYRPCLTVSLCPLISLLGITNSDATRVKQVWVQWARGSCGKLEGTCSTGKRRQLAYGLRT